MNETTTRPESSERSDERVEYQQPSVETISLDCEISAYAPDEGDVPLF
jgi:hypothetical protein